MSAIEGEVKEGVRAFGGGDFKELALFAKLLESPLVDILLALLFRLKRPIFGRGRAFRCRQWGKLDHAPPRG